MSIYRSGYDSQDPDIERQTRFRYGPLSENLSGLKLYSRHAKPEGLTRDPFLTPCEGLVFGRWTVEEIAVQLQETGVMGKWHEQGHQQIWIEMGSCNHQYRYELRVWTDQGDVSEMLVNLIVYLEFVAIEKLNASFAAMSVDHLRLQNPKCKGDKRPLAPGQDFASSGVLRPIFGLIKYWATVLGAEVILQMPEYFHSAMIFGQVFRYVDVEMAQIFAEIQSQMLGETPSQDAIVELSKAFEAGQILCNDNPYLWPTEMMAYALSHELNERLQNSSQASRENYCFSRIGQGTRSGS